MATAGSGKTGKDREWGNGAHSESPERVFQNRRA